MNSNKPPRYTIYCHTHVDSGRRYIGLTKKTMMQRWNQHLSKAKKMGDKRSHFWAAIRQYGKDAFSHEVLEVCHDLELANAAEQKWIDHFKTRDPAFGFNLTPGGAHTPHPIKNPWDRPEFRDIISKRSRDMWQDPEFRARNLPALQAMSADPEMRKRWSESTSRQFSSPESRQKMSETVKALHQVPEIAEKFRSGFRKTDAERAAKTHCKHGHEFTPENTKTDANGWRYCRRCAADRAAKKAREKRTHCKHGHEFVEGSFRLSRAGERLCLLCAKNS